MEVIMAYNYEQEINGKVYVYEIMSYWDKNKKQARQRRKYLGRKDQITGKIIDTKKKKGSKPAKVFDFGNCYFIEQIAKKIGIYDLLKGIYSMQYKEIIALVQYKISESAPLYLTSNWSEGNYIEALPEDITSQRISELLDRLGQDLESRILFFKEWIKIQKVIKSIYFDITSISTYSELLDLAEWGYNRDKEKLPQINLGIIYGRESKLPLYYTIYQGSIPDTKTLKNIIKYNKEYGIKKTIFIMDRGFYSKKNIEKLKDQEMIIPLTFSTKLSKELLKKHSRSLTEMNNIFRFNNRLYYYAKDKTTIGGINLFIHIYKDKSKYNEKETSFHLTLLEIEERLNKDKYTDKEEVLGVIEGMFKGYSKYFNIEKGKGKYLILKRNLTTIKERIDRFGTLILITNIKGLRKEEILTIQRNRDEIEKAFDMMKNDLKSNRLRVNSRERVEGSMFITYLSLIITSYIQNKLNSSEELKKYSKQGLIYELKKLKMVRYSNDLNILCETSKKIRIILKVFGIELPD
jgi:transposase